MLRLIPHPENPGVGRGDLSDEQWALPEPLLPAARPGRPPVGRRRPVNGIRRRVRTGAPWRDPPRKYGPRQSAKAWNPVPDPRALRPGRQPQPARERRRSTAKL
ncbi:transposase [Amycolatopsis mediterranei]|uniref:transposase n=1 Tax=Amycolatopsis mediterranei TaxID=33910 RepID=UPI00343965BD